MRIRKISVIFLALVMLSGCSSNKSLSSTQEKFTSWENVENQGKNKEATILMWGGNDSINKYMDSFVAQNVKEMYGITLKRVPMNAPEFITKLLNEKKGSVNQGTADLIWVSGENFRTAKQGELIWGPFTELLPNLKKYYDENADDLKFDTGVPIEGSEAIWGRAQLVLTYDSKVVPAAPKNFKELMEWVKKNPGKFTYPKFPDDFVGVSFIRTAYYELTGKSDVFQKDMTKEEFQQISKPVVAYFKEMNQYLWREGKAFPATQALQDEFFKNGEISMTMGFEIGKTAGLVKKGEYPETVKSFVFDTGTIGNSHYLAVPYNSPNKAAALLVIDFLESPKAQIEKLKAEVWGDMPALDVSKLSDDQNMELKDAEAGPGALSIKELSMHRLPEMKSQYIDWIKEIWISEIGGK
ncbi:MAG: putative spermidine/putrescine transport system substrate-binding protein [Clostridium sp.]|jgi:putative spermidine/putrescine transport system substrate-binding protein